MLKTSIFFNIYSETTLQKFVDDIFFGEISVK